ncbi:hypothetical protein [Faecalicatena contorta]|uniref:hypothetical protein n=1 Tax=Faecalicatena contorta TaxID=39482 RepID=UPI001F26C303|nr:hypothetical protein [Faecalicatena contorta]MCF2555753.1 hypothetical protein [Faecalicatena contorta]
MGMIKGISIKLYEKKEVGCDAFKHPVYEEEVSAIEDVLVAPVSTTEAIDMQNLTGKKAIYNIAIPKGDTHNWKDNRVEFFGEFWQIIGPVKRGIEENIPGEWHEIWTVAQYE